MSRLVIVRNGAAHAAQPGDVVVPVSELRRFAARARRTVRRFDEAALATSDLCHAGRPLALAAFARACARGPVYMLAPSGERRPIAAGDIVRWTRDVAVERLRRRAFVRRVARDVDREFAGLAGDPARRPIHRLSPCAYLRTDLSFGVKAGGSVGHIAGVLNNLSALGCDPVFVTTDRVPTVDARIETHLVCAAEQYWGAAELPSFVMHDVFTRAAERALGPRQIAFLYQRHSLNNFSGVQLQRTLGVPLVLEYNGSEVWVSRHWGGRRLVHEALSTRIEELNFAAASLIVVVSDAMRDELVARGVHGDKVLVNPNGVDVDQYSPAIDGSAVRRAFGIHAEIVLGFIGTFGAWHGAEVLADAYNRLLIRRADLRATTRVLYVGDGLRRPQVQALVDRGPAPSNSLFAGLVPQAEGPRYLAACDVLVSPHVPNPDGTPFFGSPTKVFEYMAMGRAIAASDLDQIGQVLRHGDTAWLTRPGDADALAAALERLIEDGELRRQLAARARADAVALHSWRRHTERILDALGREPRRGAA